MVHLPVMRLHQLHGVPWLNVWSEGAEKGGEVNLSRVSGLVQQQIVDVIAHRMREAKDFHEPQTF